MKIVLTNIILVFSVAVASAQITPSIRVTTKDKEEKRDLRLRTVAFVDSININKNNSALKIRTNNVKIADTSNVRKTTLRLSNQ